MSASCMHCFSIQSALKLGSSGVPVFHGMPVHSLDLSGQQSPRTFHLHRREL